MSRLDEITTDEIKQKDIKTLILDLFKEAEYDPWKFVEKVEAL